MATPARSVQFTDVNSLVQMYTSMKIPYYAIRQNGTQNFKFEIDDIQVGASLLEGFLQQLFDCESMAIYTLALFEDGGRITEKRDPDLSWNFRLHGQTASMGLPGEHYGGGYGQLLGEVRELKKQMIALQTKEEPENPLGVIGQIMEMDAVQPLLGAIGTRLADWVMGTPKTAVEGDIARISGIPGVPETGMGMPWREDLMLCDALDRLSQRVSDLPQIMRRLADMAEQKPGKFLVYVSMVRKM